MHAWQVTHTGEPAEVLRWTERDEPELGPGQVRCAVEAAALGWPDVALCRGAYAFRPPLPFTPGQELCGRVVEVADGHGDLAVGDRVAGISCFYSGDGAFAETTVARADTLYPVPLEMPVVEAAAFCIGFHTAHAALVVRAAVTPGETLLVHGGAGGTGSAAVRLGAALGARVIAVVGGDAKADACRAAGAHEVIDHRSADFVEQVRQLTDGRGADVIFDPVGGDTYERSFRCLADRGRILPIGLASGRWGDTPLGPMALKNVSIMTASPTGYTRATALAHHHTLVERYLRGEIAPLVDEMIGFDEIPRGLERIAAGESIGRVVATG